ncbi:MAG: preprotein translocase subunit SecG [Acutalibacteraceae bacterium]|nr:preprotein translocase subunit SecG [Acutalibacteraceae bacterium]
MVWYDYVLGGVLIVLALIIIAVILLQEGRRKGISGVIAGGADTFLSKGKAKAVDAVLAKWTKYIAMIFMLLVVVCFALSIILK